MENFNTYIAFLVSILAFSAFTKIYTTLCIFRLGLGLKSLGFGLVTLILSLTLSIFVISPQLGEFGGIEKILSNQVSDINISQFEKEFKPFLEKHSSQELSNKLINISGKLGHTETEPSFIITLISFLITELQEAFELGLIFILPFIVIDLVVANAITALAVKELPAFAVSFPLKLLLFFAVDGWALISEKLILSYT